MKAFVVWLTALLACGLPCLGNDEREVLTPDDCRGGCDMRTCEQVRPELCQGRVMKDKCNCCPICINNTLAEEEREMEWTNSTHVDKGDSQEHPCTHFTCPRFHVCLLNIQNLPVCRCPNVHLCKAKGRKNICGENGKSYKNACFLKLEECQTKTNIKVKHRGVCDADRRNPSHRERRKEKKRLRKLERKRAKLQERIGRVQAGGLEEVEQQTKAERKAMRKERRREQRREQKQEKKAERRAAKQQRKDERREQQGFLITQSQAETNETMPADAPMLDSLAELSFEQSKLQQKAETRFQRQQERKRARKHARLERRQEEKEARKAARQADKKAARRAAKRAARLSSHVDSEDNPGSHVH